MDGAGAVIDTLTHGNGVLKVFAALVEFERETVVERARLGLARARARGRSGGRPYKMTPAKLRHALDVLSKGEVEAKDLCVELGVTRQTLYRHVSPDGKVRADGLRLLSVSDPS